MMPVSLYDTHNEWVRLAPWVGRNRSVKGDVSMLFLFLGAVFVFTLAVALVGGVSEP